MTLLPEVESALLDAVRRDQRTRARGGVVRAWLRRRPRGLLIAAGALVLRRVRRGGSGSILD